MSYEASFWRVFFTHVGPGTGFSREEIDEMTDEELEAAGMAMADVLRPAFETVGRLIGAGVKAYRHERYAP